MDIVKIKNNLIGAAGVVLMFVSLGLTFNAVLPVISWLKKGYYSSNTLHEMLPYRESYTGWVIPDGIIMWLLSVDMLFVNLTVAGIVFGLSAYIMDRCDIPEEKKS